MSDQNDTNHDWWQQLQSDVPAGDDFLADVQNGAVATPKTTQAIEQTRFDSYLYERVGQNVPVLPKTVDQCAGKYDRAAALAQDVFASLYKLAPELTPADEMDPEYARHRKALQEMMNTSEYRQLWVQTQLDEMSAAIGAATLTKNLVQTLAAQDKKNPPKPPTPQGEDKSGSGINYDLGGAKGDEGDGESSGEPGEDGEGEGEPEEMSEEEKAERTELRVAARAAAEAASQDVADAQAAADAFGGENDEVGQWGHGVGKSTQAGNIKDRAALAAKVLASPRLRRIAELAGRMKTIANGAQRKKVSDKSTEVVGIEIGDELARVLPSELMRLRHPRLHLAAMRDMIEGQMLQYQLSGVEPQGQGPIVLCIDESGSMGTANSEGIERRDWCAAVFLAMLRIAAKEQRDLRLIHFGDSPLHYYGSFTKRDPGEELRVVDFPKGQAQPAAVMTEATHFFGNGEDYHLFMRASLEAINASAYNKADVILLTDGQSDVDNTALEAWTKARKEREFKAVAIQIGNDRRGLKLLQTMCDEVHVIAEAGHKDTAALTAAFGV